MTRFLLLISLFTTQIICFAQISNDPAARTLLDEVSAATDEHEAIYISFEYNLINKSENIQENTDGELTLKKNQYTLSFMGINQISDGENVWTIMEDDEEIQISEIDLDDENTLTPSNLLKMYEEGFIYQMKERNGKLQTIELLPENADNVDYIKIHLTIDTQLKQIKKLKQFGNNQTESEYVIKEFLPTTIDNNSFILNSSDFPEFEIIDLR
tara:strand:- start:947 stop:1585 length:639 start_codon:yes stop_codon:yes gene_type:complete